MPNTKTNERIEKLTKLGLCFNGNDMIHDDINVHWTEILCDTDEVFAIKLAATAEGKHIREINREDVKRIIPKKIDYRNRPLASVNGTWKINHAPDLSLHRLLKYLRDQREQETL